MATGTMTYEESSRYLSSSISSLSSNRVQSSWIAKTYRHAAQLYLTRRLFEALNAIEPVVSPDPKTSHETNGDYSETVIAAPVAAASRGTRVKVWSFYLTLLNAIIELGPEEGKLVFGSSKWRALASKAREGSVWEEVVKYGYGGAEGEVDGEVVTNLYGTRDVVNYVLADEIHQGYVTTHAHACTEAQPAKIRDVPLGICYALL